MNTESKEIKVREKQAVASAAEQTKPGLVFTPNVDIFETAATLTLLADVPGVKPKNIDIDLRDNMLTLTGEIEPAGSPDESELLIEYAIGKYYRQFTLSEVIDQTKIDAKMEHGVLRLTLPKVEKATPRKIEVNAG